MPGLLKRDCFARSIYKIYLGGHEKGRGTKDETVGKKSLSKCQRETRPILISPGDSLIKMLVAFLLQVRIEGAFSVGGGSYRAFNR
jgi:hypothetical protein